MTNKGKKDKIIHIEKIDNERRLTVQREWVGTEWEYKIVPQMFTRFFSINKKWITGSLESTGSLLMRVPICHSKSEAIRMCKAIKENYLT